MDRSLASEEAQRWLGTSEKLLAARDLSGAKSFAIRVREAFPRLESAADDVISVADTLSAGETRFGSSRDWYAVLGLPRFTHNLEVVANQYRRLALILNPHRNRLPYADEAFRLVTESWSVLSNSSKKSFFDNELAVHSRYEFAAGAQSHAHTQSQNHIHLQEHQFLQRNNHQPQPQTQPQFQLHQHQHQTHQLHQHQQHQFFNQNPQFQPEPLQSHPHWQQQPQTQPQPQPQQQAQAATRRSSPNRNQAVIEEDLPNLNNDAIRPPDISPPPPPPPPPPPAPPSPEASPEREETLLSELEKPEGPTFWTACPYCYILYEYPEAYEDCVLRCQTCKRAFTAGPIPAPPFGPDGEPGPNYFCCWGFFPLGSSGKAEAGAGNGGAGWSPFSPMFAAPVQDKGAGTSGKEKRKRGDSPRVVYKDDYEDSDDDDFMIEISDDGDDETDADWRKTGKSGGGSGKKSKASSSSSKGRAKKVAKKSSTMPQTDRVTRARQSQSQSENQVVNGGGGEKESEKKNERPALRRVVLGAAAATAETGRKSKLAGRKKGGADWGRLDLNVEFNNDSDEPVRARKAAANRTNGAGNRDRDAGSGGEDDNIEGIGFFEGLDEFLSSLPILNVAGDEKVKAA